MNMEPRSDPELPSTDLVPAIADAYVPLTTSDLMSDDEINRMWRIAKALAASGMFKDISQAEQAFGKMIVGRDLGLTPAQSMQGLYMVEGRIHVAYPMLGHFVRSRGGCDYRALSHSEAECSIEFGRGVAPGRDPATGEWLPWPESLGVSTFTLADAKLAGVADKPPWKRYPRNMLFARAMSNGCKWYMPEVLNGLPVYVEGETNSVRFVDGGEATGELVAGDVVVAWPAGLLGDEMREAVATIHAAHPDRYPPAVLQMMLGAQNVESLQVLAERFNDEAVAAAEDLVRRAGPEGMTIEEASEAVDAEVDRLNEEVFFGDADGGDVPGQDDTEA